MHLGQRLLRVGQDLPFSSTTPLRLYVHEGMHVGPGCLGDFAVVLRGS
jgi:hypothetical protein